MSFPIPTLGMTSSGDPFWLRARDAQMSARERAMRDADEYLAARVRCDYATSDAARARLVSVGCVVHGATVYGPTHYLGQHE